MKRGSMRDKHYIYSLAEVRHGILSPLSHWQYCAENKWVPKSSGIRVKKQ